MLGRLVRWIGIVLVGVTQFGINTLCAGLFWVVTGRGKLSDPDETFSSRVGRNAVAGKRWALIAEKVIDALLGANHCRDSIEGGAK